MNAIIFNSGLGSRMGTLTENNPKCLVKLYNGETILHRQIRILSSYNIKNFIITTGPFKELIIEETKKFSGLNFIFVENNNYKNTNYIVSMNNAYDYLDDDCLLLHGDLVFNKELIMKMLNSKAKSLCLYNKSKKLPEKDFKGRFKDNILQEVSINIFDKNCYAFQPLYKLDKNTLLMWKNRVRSFVNDNNVKVYAENALNEITNNIKIEGLSYEDDYIDEIDNESDYIRVSNDIKYFDYREQTIIEMANYISALKKFIKDDEKIFVVCGTSLRSKVERDLKTINNNFTFFSDFTPNPKYEDVKKALNLFKEMNCSKIISIGGGSSIDVAKCIKAFYSLKNEFDFLKQKYVYNNIVHIAIPTTSGTGSESTQFAVIYYNNKKISIDHGSLLPDVAILDCNFLQSLSLYQKKSTLLDALCQAIEAYWAKSANETSKNYSINCIHLILNNYKSYIKNSNTDSLYNILKASNLSGHAINIAKTTAPHAMSYILTSKYNISHGHAVALCIVPCWRFLHKKSQNDTDLKNVLLSLAEILNTNSIAESISLVDNIIKDLSLKPIIINNADLTILSKSVNSERLSNNPIIFDKTDLNTLYKSI
ncbi:MAG: iron-containing alcohol dehydrogenase [Clostridiaceae bacterium]|nr:iron-containing alcohol dehydrogenase [Clostridiaceae bacterium]